MKIKLDTSGGSPCPAGKSTIIHASLQGTLGHFLVRAKLDAQVRMVETF